MIYHVLILNDIDASDCYCEDVQNVHEVAEHCDDEQEEDDHEGEEVYDEEEGDENEDEEVYGEEEGDDHEEGEVDDEEEGDDNEEGEVGDEEEGDDNEDLDAVEIAEHQPPHLHVYVFLADSQKVARKSGNDVFLHTSKITATTMITTTTTTT